MILPLISHDPPNVLRKGFTLIEILIVVALVGIFASVGLFISMDIYRSTLFSMDEDLFNSLLIFAREEAVADRAGVPHGVHITGNAFVVFGGYDYKSNDLNNIIFSRNSDVSTSGLSEVIFASLTGSPLAAGTISMTTNEKVARFSIDENGIILNDFSHN